MNLMFSQNVLLYFAAVVFFGTYILIASEKIHKLLPLSWEPC